MVLFGGFVYFVQSLIIIFHISAGVKDAISVSAALQLCVSTSDTGPADRTAPKRKSPSHSPNGHSSADTSPCPMKKKKKPGAVSSSKDQVTLKVQPITHPATSSCMHPQRNVHHIDTNRIFKGSQRVVSYLKTFFLWTVLLLSSSDFVQIVAAALVWSWNSFNYKSQSKCSLVADNPSLCTQHVSHCAYCSRCISVDFNFCQLNWNFHWRENVSVCHRIMERWMSQCKTEWIVLLIVAVCWCSACLLCFFCLWADFDLPPLCVSFCLHSSQN